MEPFVKRMAEREGFEPSFDNSQNVEGQCSCEIREPHNPQIAPQDLFADDPELARLVESWEQLPHAYKRAIMAIVSSV